MLRKIFGAERDEVTGEWSFMNCTAEKILLG